MIITFIVYHPAWELKCLFFFYLEHLEWNGPDYQTCYSLDNVG